MTRIDLTTITTPVGYELTYSGVLKEFKSHKGEITLQNITGDAIWVKCLTRSGATQTNYGIVVAYINPEGIEGELNIKMADLFDASGKVAKQLMSIGVRILKGPRELYEYLLLMSSGSEIAELVTQSGWCDDLLVFMTPDRQFGTSSKPIVNGISTGQCVLSSNGDLIDWQREVADLLGDNPWRLFALVASLASPLLELLNLEGGGFHYSSETSTGKTTMLEIAASAWGNPSGNSGGYMSSWHATGNGIEGRCRSHSGLGLVLDEIGCFVGRDLDAVSYTIANGLAKETMTSDRELRHDVSWRLIFQSSGEMSARHKIELDGCEYKDGMSVRIVDIPLPFLTGDIDASRRLTDRIKKACTENYGTAGPAFLEGLVAICETRDDLEEMLKENYATICDNLITADMTTEKARVAKRFSIVELAGYLAVEFGILNVTEDKITDAVKTVMSAWESNPEHIGMAERGILNLQHYLIEQQAFFFDANADIPTGQRPAGYRRNGRLLILSDNFSLACGDVPERIVLNELKARQLLVTHNTKPGGGRAPTRMDIGFGRERALGITLKESLLGLDAIKEELEASAASMSNAIAG